MATDESLQFQNEIRKRREQVMREKGILVEEEPTQQQNGGNRYNNYNSPPRPTTLPAQSTTNGKNDRPYQLIQLCIDYQISPDITIPVLIDYAYSTSDRNLVRSIKQWGERYKTIDIVGIDRDGYIERLGKDKSSKTITECVNIRDQLLECVRIAENVNNTPPPKAEPQIMFIEKIPKLAWFSWWSISICLMALIAYLVWMVTF